MRTEIFRPTPHVQVVDNAIAKSTFRAFMSFVKEVEERHSPDDFLRMGSCPGTFWFPLDQKPRHVLEKTILAMKEWVKPGRACIGVEWWFGFRPDGMGMNNHFDKDESRLRATGKMRTPMRASLLYLSDIGLPTMIHDLAPTDLKPERVQKRRPCTTVFVPPRQNRVTAFQGNFYHGSGSPLVKELNAKPGPAIRKFFAVNWWDRRPAEPWCLNLKTEWIPEFPRFVLKAHEASQQRSY
jgi:hypothetical protein